MFSLQATLNMMIRTAIFQIIGSLTLIEAAMLYCYSSPDLNSYEIATFDIAENFIDSKCINTSRTTAIYTHGFNENPKSLTVVHALSILLSLGDQNVVLLDWEQEASSDSSAIGTVANYALRAVPSTGSVGKKLGETVVRLTNYGLDLNLVHLIGHSLGSHLMGYAGKAIIELGKIVNRITGLDPARPLYEYIIMNHLDKTCAKFVDAIHTDPAHYGLKNPMGTVDVYFNYGLYQSGINAQPPCMNSSDTNFVGNLCSHVFSVEVFFDALVNKTQYIASAADSYDAWVAQNGTGSNIIYIGNMDETANGTFYISTNAQQPYGKGIAGLKP